jgi:hypothetical protein
VQGGIQVTHIFTAVTDDWLPLWELVRPNWEEYCARHDYTLYVEEGFDASMPFTFAKIKAALEYFENNVLLCNDDDWLVIMDADIVFTNMAIKIDEMFTSGAVSITKDVNGLNSGVMGINNNGPDVRSVSRLFLKTVVSLRGVFRSEQDAIQTIAEAFDWDIDYIGHPSFNSIVLDEYPIYAGKYTEKDGNWAPGHLLAHFPGMSMEQRLALIPKYLALVQR